MIIGISGKKQHGKDTAADFILKEFPEFEHKKFAGKLKEMVCLMIGCTMEELEDPVFKETPLGEEWDKWRVDSFYMPETLDSEVNAFYDYINYFNTKEEAVSFGESEKKKYNVPSKEKVYGMSSDYDYSVVKEEITPRKLLQLLGTECGRQIIHPNVWVNSTMADYKGGDNWVLSDVRFPNEAEAVRKRGGLLFRVNRPSMESTDQHESETALDNYQHWDKVIINDGSLEDLENKIIYSIV